MLKILKPHLSIITLCCNRLEYTSQTISSVISAVGDIEYEYIVVNAASFDGTKEWLNHVSQLDYFKKLKPVHLNHNKGIWDGYSEGVKASSSEIILITDNDIVVHTKDVGKIVLGSKYPYGMADFVEYQKNRRSKFVGYPVAFFYMDKKYFRFDYKLPDDYQNSGMQFFVHPDIICEHIDGGEANNYVDLSLSKIKYPPHIIYNNLEGNCPMGNSPFRQKGKESKFWRK
ncbi:MAG: glycosyltransferase family 2 protein [Thaumarchaeota archaeon]|nr:glycosyltransferase family 2 protein [Nitrososphaerota archaeon]